MLGFWSKRGRHYLTYAISKLQCIEALCVARLCDTKAAVREIDWKRDIYSVDVL